MTLAPDSHSIRRLRFRGRPANPVALRRRLEASLSDGAEHTSRLSPQAILCVRRLALTRRETGDLRGLLDAETAGAARPAREPVPAGANAVLFADGAEMLACLARDWCATGAVGCWWWATLFPGWTIADTVRRTWLEDARRVPAALERLQTAGLASAFLCKLPATDIAAMWSNVVQAFDLAELDAAWSAGSQTRREDQPRARLTASKPASIARSAAPWAGWVQAEPSLPEPGRRLLVGAILLVRAPAIVRSRAFAREVAAWTLAAEPREPPPPQPLQGARDPVRVQGQTQHGDGAALSDSELVRGPESLSPPVMPALPKTSHSTEQPYSAARWPAGNSVRPPDRVLRVEDAVSATESNAQPPSLPPAGAPNRIVTEWGGVFYLINTALALGFYGDFTMPAQPGLALPLWDFLALVGGRMIGDAFTTDPLPGLLARLSGRGDGEPPGARFEPPGDEPIALWLDRISDQVEARLSAALDVEDRETLRRFVCRHLAQVETDTIRLNVHFSLAAHPIELRIAGLDRDPGWVPAGGLSIAFHYD